MATINLITNIHAPAVVVFDLSRSIDLHKLSTQRTEEEAIAGKISGLINEGETVTWRAKHLYKYRLFTSRITAFEAPVYFKDEMVHGDFKKFEHEHFFAERDNITTMRDTVVLEAPYGLAGKIGTAIFLKNYIKSFLVQRNEMIKEFAENNKWKSILHND